MIITYKSINGNEKCINKENQPIFKSIVDKNTGFNIGVVEKTINNSSKKQKIYNLISIKNYTFGEIEYLDYEELLCDLEEEEVDILLSQKNQVIKVTRSYYHYDNKGNQEEYYSQSMNWPYLHLERYIRNYMHSVKYDKISVEKQKDHVFLYFGKYDEFLKESVPF